MKGLIPFVVAFATLLSGCGNSEGDASFHATRQVTLPDGSPIQAEVEITAAEMQKGMMFRTSLPAGQGMLFVHGVTGNYPYWMANCKFPLDIIWMDTSHQVVEISPNTPPCPAGGSDCPTFGGHARAQYVLELAGGQAQLHQIRPGSALKF